MKEERSHKKYLNEYFQGYDGDSHSRRNSTMLLR